MKSHYFADEAEWRYLLQIDDDHPVRDAPIEFHARSHYIKPFVAFPPREASLPCLPISRVICGPRLDAELAIPGTTRFLALSGYSDVTVEPSVLTDIWR